MPKNPLCVGPSFSFLFISLTIVLPSTREPSFNMMMPRQSSYPQHQTMHQAQDAYDSQNYAQMQMPQPSQHLISSLQSCVSSTASCVQTMKEAIDTLEFAIQDHPRLMTVLRSQRHFDLVSERDIQSAREHVASEVRPHVEELCRRANAEIQRQERRAVALRNRDESLQQRIQNLRSIESHQSKLNHPASGPEHKGTESQHDKQLQIQLEEQRARLAHLKAEKAKLLARADELETQLQG